MKRTGYLHQAMQCEMLSLECDFRRKEVWIKFPSGDCCDMDGCTTWIEGICPDMERIFTFSGHEPDTAYLKLGGAWHAARCIQVEGQWRFVVID